MRVDGLRDLHFHTRPRHALARFGPFGSESLNADLRFPAPVPLTLVGLGLWDEQDVSLRGLEAARKADVVFAEGYTAFLGGADPARLEALVGKPVRTLSRTDVEAPAELLEAARTKDVVLLVVGDSLTATTHTDLRLRARELGIPTRVVHGASIATAVPGLLGLANYKFGRSTTIVFPHGNYFPTSPYDVVRDNRERGLHTLVLLDLRAAEGRYMTGTLGAQLLLRMEAERGEKALLDDTQAYVLARAGSPAPGVWRGRLLDLAKHDYGPPLHTMVVPGKLQHFEEDAVSVLAREVPRA